MMMLMVTKEQPAREREHQMCTNLTVHLSSHGRRREENARIPHVDILLLAHCIHLREFDERNAP